jgi:hypothetical protein
VKRDVMQSAQPGCDLLIAALTCNVRCQTGVELVSCPESRVNSRYLGVATVKVQACFSQPCAACALCSLPHQVWDLEAQACVQTVVGHKAEVWALAVDPGQTRVITGV